MENKKQLIEHIKKGFKQIQLAERKNHKKFIKILPKLSIKELQEIIIENDIEIYYFEKEREEKL